MRTVPESLSADWIDSLTNDELVDVERRTHEKFTVAQQREKKLRGDRYDLMRGSAELMLAWHRWGRIANAMRERSLRPNRSAAVGD